MILSGVKGVTVRGNNVKEIIRGGVTLWEAPSKVDKYTWEGVFANIDNGTYADVYKVGDTLALDVGGKEYTVEIVAIDADDLADGSGKAPITWFGKSNYESNRAMNPSLVANDDGTYQEGTGSIGGWEKCEMRKHLHEVVKPLIAENVRNRIRTVTKYSNIRDVNGKIVKDDVTEDDVWLMSAAEYTGYSYYETKYPAIYKTTGKFVSSTGTYGSWLRTTGTYYKEKYTCMYYSSSNNKNVHDEEANATSYMAYAFGFCT